MSSIYFTKDQTAQGDVNKSKLMAEIESSAIETEIKNISITDVGFYVIFDNDLSGPELSTLEQIVSTHHYLSTQERVMLIVSRAIEFGNNMILEFAAENIMMGITQLGKTKDVADYLATVMRYTQSGSLYEVVGEIERLKANGLPPDLAPFVTEARLNVFKNKILAYLAGMP